MLDKDMRGMYIWPPSPSSVSTWVCGRGVKQDYVNPPCMDTESIMPVDHVLVLILFFCLVREKPKLLQCSGNCNNHLNIVSVLLMHLDFAV